MKQRKNRSGTEEQLSGNRALRSFGVFLLGAVGYCCLEMGWRGYTHWSMGAAGGVCLMGLLYLSDRLADRPVWQQALAGALLITGVEWCAGCVVNIILGWGVWDYSGLRLQIAGQVSLLFSFFWYLISFAVFGVFTLAKKSRGNS